MNHAFSDYCEVQWSEHVYTEIKQIGSSNSCDCLFGKEAMDDNRATGHLRGLNLNWTKSWRVAAAVKHDKSWTPKHDTRLIATYEKLYNFSSHPSIKSDSCDSGYRSVSQVSTHR